ncbi:hypothetical protein [Methylobacterium sp. CM6246]
MTFPPFSEVEATITRAVMPADHLPRPEQITPERAAQALYAKDYWAMMLGGSDKQLGVAIVRSFGRGVRFGNALNSGAAMQAVRYHQQRLCTAAQAAHLDSEHLVAVRAESERCARQMGRGLNTGIAE